MSYQQLTERQRYRISALLARGCSQTVIAETLCKSKSTISRELSGVVDQIIYITY
ncbi:helix-turn-helix domain-containing protein [Salinivibrio sp. YCSC6]|uniref:helix-turn-helix domain-containing protein n=1 Tax=Salinivibrio sp. YCSC6 TaxID=2003370 RepID=UPI000BBCF4F3|nr:hypothetical protein B6G00_03690 [Salinivibrio sp. YCSC6]QCF35621.1 helix-turn-helix domain-containing protein [Salinivibrio sp. YCSC6]